MTVYVFIAHTTGIYIISGHCPPVWHNQAPWSWFYLEQTWAYVLNYPLISLSDVLEGSILKHTFLWHHAESRNNVNWLYLLAFDFLPNLCYENMYIFSKPYVKMFLTVTSSVFCLMFSFFYLNNFKYKLHWYLWKRIKKNHSFKL